MRASTTSMSASQTAIAWPPFLFSTASRKWPLPWAWAPMTATLIRSLAPAARVHELMGTERPATSEPLRKVRREVCFIRGWVSVGRWKSEKGTEGKPGHGCAAWEQCHAIAGCCTGHLAGGGEHLIF